MLLSALGSRDEPPDIDVSECMRLLPGDVLLLCSDGVWELLGDERLIESAHAAHDPDQWFELIDAQVNALGKPGQDNCTALALWMREGDDSDRMRLLPPVPDSGRATSG
ncbi:MAG TPA: SpoIIE family protein phosphatase [Ottowia sp.]|uniref:PP2C family protein-serine/threonine phosphatase n=1 Tax=Ottowia sp. TaxID=1898956 RepID=UPI002BA37BF3|nr:hypothetical protein [Ottowia sp.]HMN20143.1 SpoIIE family protein phosphatase [Ottowia sp.]